MLLVPHFDGLFFVTAGHRDNEKKSSRHASPASSVHRSSVCSASSSEDEHHTSPSSTSSHVGVLKSLRKQHHQHDAADEGIEGFGMLTETLSAVTAIAIGVDGVADKDF